MTEDFSFEQDGLPGDGAQAWFGLVLVGLSAGGSAAGLIWLATILRPFIIH